jgi:AcrR family transcriptional regulator
MGEAVPGLRERKKQRTRATLIDAAVELCTRQGFERTTVEQIAAIADVSPRTFSRYFATKEAVALALMDDAIELAAVELSRQPADISHLQALRQAFVALSGHTEAAGSSALNAERLMCTVRIIMSSPTLRQAVTEYRPHAINIELAERMGVGPDDRGLKLVAALWASITMTALADLGPSTDWQDISVDDVISRIEATFAQFIDVVADVQQPV